MNPKTISEHIRYRKCQFDHSPKWIIHKTISTESWYGFDCIREMDGLPSEIVLVPLHGHTRGHCGIAIKTQDCWVLYTGDVYHFEQLINDYSKCPRRIKIFEFFMHEKNRDAMKQIVKVWKLVSSHRDEIKVCSTHGLTEFKQIDSLPF